MIRPLSKSRVVAGMICPRRLWLLTHKPELPRQPLTAGGSKSIADGHAVGELAQKQYRDGLLLDVNTRNLEANIKKTAEYLRAPGDLTLFDAIGDAGPVFVYHQDYEKGILRTCGELLPDLAPRLQAIVDRVVDLEDIANPHYYHPDMMGSWSIKAVLPTIAPDMNYDDLEEVQDGMSAKVAFLEMIEPKTPAQRKEELRQRLLRYCGMDSEAMVRLAGFLSR